MQDQFNKFENFSSQNLKLDKFLFVYPESRLSNLGLFEKVNLQISVLVVNIIYLLLSTGQLAGCFEDVSLFKFIGNFIPSIITIAGTVLLLLSIENLEKKKAYLGYVLFVIGLAFEVVFSSIGLIANSGFVINVFKLLFITLISVYFTWINYCYAKHLHFNRRSLVLSNFGLQTEDEIKENEKMNQTTTLN